MFQQTFVSESKKARTTYSLIVSLLIQITALLVVCAVPFVFTQVLPVVRLRTVLAAPPPPVAYKAPVTANSMPSLSGRAFSLANFRIVKGPLPPASNPSLDVPPGVSTTDLVGDTNGVPFADPLGMGTVEIKAPPPARIEKHEPSGPVRLGSVLVNGNLLYKVQPLYPALARSNHIQGVVEFTAIISREGTIQNLQLKRGHPLLVNAARDAVLQWRYRPTILNGQAVEVITDIIVNFNLNQ